MPALLRERNFALLWFGGLISMTGDWMLGIALPTYVFELTGSTLATGAMFIASTVPRLLLSSVAGVFVDRWNRQRTMVIVNLILAAGLLPLLLVRSESMLWLVYVVAFAKAAVGQFFGPAENALLPTLVGEEHLVAANSMNVLNNNLARLIGPALGGAVALALGLPGVVVIDTVTFLAAALLIALIRQAAPDQTDAALQAGGPQGAALRALVRLWRDWRAGLGVVRRQRLLAVLFAFGALTATGEGVIAVLLVPFVTEVLGGAALELGWLMSAQAVGGLLGSAVIARLGSRLLPRRILGPSAMLFGLIDLLIFNYPAFFGGVTIALALFVLVGLPAAALGASFSTLLQQGVADAYRGRVFGALVATESLLMLGGMGLASVAGDVVGIVAVINIQAFVYLLGGLLTLVLLQSAREPEYKTA
jgi:MFS family permease